MIEYVERFHAQLEANSLSDWEILIESDIERDFFRAAHIARLGIAEFAPRGRLERCRAEVTRMAQVRFPISGMRNRGNLIRAGRQTGVADREHRRYRQSALDNRQYHYKHDDLDQQDNASRASKLLEWRKKGIS